MDLITLNDDELQDRITVLSQELGKLKALFGHASSMEEDLARNPVLVLLQPDGTYTRKPYADCTIGEYRLHCEGTQHYADVAKAHLTACREALRRLEQRESGEAVPLHKG